MSDFCADIVRRHDYDRFVISLRAPAAARAGLWALYALNYEIARTRETVTDAPLGRIRLQWWREAVDAAMHLESPQFHHEILRALVPALHAAGVGAAPLHALIDAREADMDSAALQGVDDLAAYARDTNLPLLQIGAALCGQGYGETDAARLAAVAGAYGLVGMMRAHMFHGGGAAALQQGGGADAVRARAKELLDKELLDAAAGLRGLVGAHGALARIYWRRMPDYGPETPPFLLLRLMFSAR